MSGSYISAGGDVVAADNLLGDVVETSPFSGGKIVSKEVHATFMRITARIKSVLAEGALARAIYKSPSELELAREHVHLIKGLDIRHMAQSKMDDDDRHGLLFQAAIGVMFLSRAILAATIILLFIMTCIWTQSGWWPTNLNYQGVWLTTDGAGNVIQDPSDFLAGTNVRIVWFFFSIFLVHMIYGSGVLAFFTINDDNHDPIMQYVHVLGRRDADILGLHAECLVWIPTMHWFVANLLGIRDPSTTGVIIALAVVGQVIAIAVEYMNAIPEEFVTRNGKKMINPDSTLIPSHLRYIIRDRPLIGRVFCWVTLFAVELSWAIKYPGEAQKFSTLFSFISLTVVDFCFMFMQWLYLRQVSMSDRVKEARGMDDDATREFFVSLETSLKNDPETRTLISNLDEDMQGNAFNLINNTAWEQVAHHYFQPSWTRATYVAIGVLLLAYLINAIWWSVWAQTRHDDYNPSFPF